MPEYKRACAMWARIANAIADDGVTFDPGFKAFRRNGRVVSGLTRSLSVCWKNYNYKKLNCGAARKFLRRDKTLKNPRAGRARGSMVHRQLEGFVNGDLTEDMHGFGIDALAMIRKLGLCPIKAEAPVFDSTTGLATAVDMIAAAPGGKLAFIEIKNGSLGTFRRSSAKMFGPFGKVLRNSPREQALAQLAMTVRAAEQYGAHVAEAYVINPNAEECTFVPLPPEVRRATPAAAAFILNCREAARVRKTQAANRAAGASC